MSNYESSDKKIVECNSPGTHDNCMVKKAIHSYVVRLIMRIEFFFYLVGTILMSKISHDFSI